MLIMASCRRLQTGFAISAVTLIALNYIFPPAGLYEVDEYDVYGTFEEVLGPGVHPDIESSHGGDPASVTEEDKKDGACMTVGPAF